ncbi:MAG: hypothetical protein WB284_02960 [Methanoregula sp.]
MPEPLPVESNDLEDEGDALGIEAVMQIRGEQVRMREPGAAEVTCERDDKDKTVCTPTIAAGRSPRCSCPFASERSTSQMSPFFIRFYAPGK